ncbi:MAG TPA: neutral/alkaline non-lysosomal ceramidase N-terminal domain-containing protein [Gemmatimonadales bacterium]
MSRVSRACFVLSTLAALAPACAKPFLVEGDLSPPPRPGGSAGLRAGFGRADITPPPGVGLAGNGPEGRRATGYRLRLYARALVLEDPGGNRIALVVADLGLGSALLHRRVAALTAAADSIGIDRLVLTVTHIHSGPGHYFEAAALNEQSSSVVGYDPVLLDSLARRIAAAVHAAKLDLREAKAAWGSRRLWGFSRIRSLPAQLRDLPLPTPPADAPPALDPAYRLIDPTFTMLRIDQRDSAGGSFRPAGAFSVFAIHGTGNAPAGELLDPDIGGIVERKLERHIDPSGAFVPRAFHLFAPGSEGDVSPAWSPDSRCGVPVVAPWPMLDGPFTRPLWQWKPDAPRNQASCIQAARRSIELLGNALGDSAIALFESLAGGLDSQLELARAFTTLALREDAESLGICPVPAGGMALLAGADDAAGRLRGWRMLGLLSLDMEQGAARKKPAGCQGAKHQVLDLFFGSLPNKLLGTKILPSFAQVTVLRIGNRLIGTVPGEVTTVAGRRMQAAMLAGASGIGVPVDSALVMGLSNGHVMYVATAEEYGAQYYEGASTIYGPGEAAMFARALGGLAGMLSSGDTLPSASAGRMTVLPGKHQAILRSRGSQVTPTPLLERVWCSADTLYADFRLGSVADWPTTGPRIEVLHEGRVVAWDDDSRVELQLRSAHKSPARWQLRWSGAVADAAYRVRVSGGALSAPLRCRKQP